MGYLLDINVLIARSDPGHVFHQRAADWTAVSMKKGFYLCPLVENGFLRIYGHPRYAGGPGGVEAVLLDLTELRRLPDIGFVSDDVSFTESKRFHHMAKVDGKELTDLYLLALAARHGMRFATFDEGIDASRVEGGLDALLVLP